MMPYNGPEELEARPNIHHWTTEWSDEETSVFEGRTEMEDPICSLIREGSRFRVETDGYTVLNELDLSSIQNKLSEVKQSLSHDTQ